MPCDADLALQDDPRTIDEMLRREARTLVRSMTNFKNWIATAKAHQVWPAAWFQIVSQKNPGEVVQRFDALVGTASNTDRMADDPLRVQVRRLVDEALETFDSPGVTTCALVRKAQRSPPRR